jgi:hypothetical protein
MKKYILFNLCLSTMVAGSCQQQGSKSERTYERENFKQYWYAGAAEINTYQLTQARYGEPRRGKAVLIFVTEDFSKSKQVKLDDPSEAGSDKVSVLKLNTTKNFITGIYPYSMMQSVFTPVNRHQAPNSLKTSMSSQEWCGHVFTQLNLRGNQVDVNSFSYFEQESDKSYSVKATLLEDEIWNIIRLEHTALPTGNFEIIPGLFFTRLSHSELKPQPASATKSESGSLITYTVTIPDQRRSLSIQFDKVFPYKIVGWEEKFMERGVQQVTKASLDKTLVTDYWAKNKNEFQYLRDSLNLSTPY